MGGLYRAAMRRPREKSGGVGAVLVGLGRSFGGCKYDQMIANVSAKSGGFLVRWAT